VIYEDGRQTRDFVYVKDVAWANLLALESDKANGRVFNVGTGSRVSIYDIAKTLARIYGKDIEPEVGDKFRPGEVRHIVADISRIKELGFRPQYDFEQGIREYVEWIKSQGEIKDYFSQAERDLSAAHIVRDSR
jgi:nucleoside-diphosphate-sugar epimerase